MASSIYGRGSDGKELPNSANVLNVNQHEDKVEAASPQLLVPIDEEDEELVDESSEGIKTDTTYMENAD